MAKIKITEKEIEIEGTVEEKKVTPFGTSAHIPVSKKHSGKYVSVVVPSKSKYFWLLTSGELKEINIVVDKIIEKKDSKLHHYRLGCLKNINQTKFHLGDLQKVYELLKESKNHKHLVKKLKEAYNLNSY